MLISIIVKHYEYTQIDVWFIKKVCTECLEKFYNIIKQL